MKTKGLSILIALAFLVLSCAGVAPKASLQGGSLPTPGPGFPSDYSEDPYALPLAVEVSAIENAVEESQHGLPGSRGPLLSAVDLTAIQDVIGRTKPLE